MSRIFVSKSDYWDICKLNLNNETEILRLCEIIYYLIKKTVQFFGFSIYTKRNISMRHGERFKKSVKLQKYLSKVPWGLLSIDHLKITAESNYIPKTPVTINYKHNVSTNNYFMFISIVFIYVLYVSN